MSKPLNKERLFRLASLIFLSALLLCYLIRAIYFYVVIDHPELWPW